MVNNNKQNRSVSKMVKEKSRATSNSNQKLKKIHVFLLALIASVIFITVRNIVASNLQKILLPEPPISEPIKDPPVKYILYWTAMFDNKDFNLGLGKEIFENCTYKNCYTTYDRTFLPVEQFDAILFHGPEYLTEFHGVPQVREPNQVYIYSNQESPVNTGSSAQPYKKFYNWTMTYRLDSDLIRNYGHMIKKITAYKPPSLHSIKKRSRKIAWFVSHCSTNSKREVLAEQINSHMKIDTYGVCGGNLSCPKNFGQYCYRMLEKNYKFYLSAENSLCLDYVTEKLFNYLKVDVVPIVFGLANYDVIAPPKSVINVADFRSIEDLVSRLKYLDDNPEEYLKYFEWKKQYVIDTGSQGMLCTLCEKLNNIKQNNKVYDDINEWFIGKHQKVCITSNNMSIINSMDSNTTNELNQTLFL